MGKPLLDSNCYIADNVPEALLNVTVVAPYLQFKRSSTSTGLKEAAIRPT